MAALAASMILAASGTSMARAGAVGDTIVALGSWVGTVETAIVGWVEKAWDGLSGNRLGAGVSDDLRRMVMENPEQLALVGKRAGYRLAGYTLDGATAGAVVLRFRFDHRLGDGDRSVLVQEIAAARDVRPRADLELIGILIDASDWRDARADGTFDMTGVDVVIDDGIRSHLVFDNVGGNSQ